MMFAASIDGFSGRSNAPAALAVPARDNGREGAMVTEERGGMAGAGQGTCALRKAGSGKESPLFVTAGPRREDGDLSGWDGEKGGPGMGSG